MRKYASLSTTDDSIAFAVDADYDTGFIQGLKSIPVWAKWWDVSKRLWHIDLEYLHEVLMILDQCQIHASYNERQLRFEASVAASRQTTERVLRVEYMGKPKLRDGGKVMGLGLLKQQVTSAFPVRVLKAFFHVQVNTPLVRPQGDNAYEVLGLSPHSSAGEIKKQYRQLIKLWHPDVNKEPDADRITQSIRGAYELLCDDKRRQRLDWAIKQAALVDNSPRTQEAVEIEDNWRPPKQCGNVTVRGKQSVHFLAESILGWDLITNEQGHIMVSYWPSQQDGKVKQYEYYWQVPKKNEEYDDE